MTELYVLSPEVRHYMDLARYRFQTLVLLRRYRASRPQ